MGSGRWAAMIQFAVHRVREMGAARRSAVEMLAAALAGLLLGLAASTLGWPLLAAVGLGALGMVILGAVVSLGYRVFWAYVCFILTGYLFLGKGFAYVGFYPIYVGEVGLGLAVASSLLVVLLSRRARSRLSRFLRPEVVLLLAFMAWQAIRTLLCLPLYGLDAARDAMVWGYAIYALSIFLLIPRNAVDAVFRLYGRMLPLYLLWLPVAFVLVKLSTVGIRFPGSPVPLVFLKSGDVGVHLAGAAAFILLRLDRRSRAWSHAKVWALWLLWGIAWVGFGASNRAGLLSALVGVGVVMFWRPKARWYRPFVLLAVVLGLLFVTGADLLVRGNQNVSFEQMVANFESLIGESQQRLEGTEDWRLGWWGTIVDYTLFGKYFWLGKGYGINLAVDDLGNVSSSNRSPHNVFMTILARSGAPGLALWVLFLAAFGGMLVARVRKRRANPEPSDGALWLLAYWLAFLFNACFDVFLEGPMGGVWFWSLVGMSLVYLRGERPGLPPQDADGSVAPRQTLAIRTPES